jgi:hypothetical protein
MENLNNDKEFFQNCEKCFQQNGKCNAISCYQRETENAEFETENPTYQKELYSKTLRLKRTKCNCSRYPQTELTLIDLETKSVITEIICLHCHNTKLKHVVLISDYLKRLETTIDLKTAVLEDKQQNGFETGDLENEISRLEKQFKRFFRILLTGKLEE